MTSSTRRIAASAKLAACRIGNDRVGAGCVITRCDTSVLRFRKEVGEGGRHCRTSRAGGSQSTTGVTANAASANERGSDGLELVDTAFSRGFGTAIDAGLLESADSTFAV